MQYFKREKVTGLLAALVIFIGGTSTALAVGTASGTPVNNTATVDYLVGADARSANDSAAFTVDNRVDLTVVNQDGGNVSVNPGATDQVLEFLVTNTGNNIQGYLLSVVNGTLNINMNNVEVWVETNATAGLQTGGGGDTQYTLASGNNAFNLDPNSLVPGADQATVYIVADTPAGAVDLDTDTYSLLVETATSVPVGNAATAVTATGPTAGEDIVLADDPAPSTGGPADGSRDGDHSDSGTYIVQSADLAMDKTIETTVDEFGTGFSIPGAVINYELTVTNNGGATAASVVVTDPIPTETRLCVAVNGDCPAVPAFTASTSGLAAPVGGFEYSQVDCTSFTGYTPVDSGDGTDATVRCIRLQPTGSMTGSGGTFDIDFFVVID